MGDSPEISANGDNEPLLARLESQITIDGCSKEKSKRLLIRRFTTPFWILSVCSLVCSIAIWRFGVVKPMHELPDIVYSPARVAETFQAVLFDGALNTTNPYKGSPGPELDAAWEGLYEVGPFIVTPRILGKINKTSVELPTRPGYHLTKLAVFHQLHCLDMVRRYVHHNYYKMDGSNSWVPLVDHVDHCVDMLRQALMCQSDTTLITFSWGGPFTRTEPDFSSTHACKNFRKIRQWAKDREINITDELAQNPEALRRLLINHIDEKLNRIDGEADNLAPSQLQ